MIEASHPMPRESEVFRSSLGRLLGYFLWLGTFGFGGPIALAGYMQRDLVERRRWFTETDYKEGLALAQLAPGPLAAQLAMYLGWVRAGLLGATLVSAAFIGPSLVMVLALSWLYLRYGGLPWMQGAFYGIGAAVIAIIARSAWKLVKMSGGKDRLLLGILIASALVTAWTESEIVWLFVGSGVLALLVRAPPRLRRAPPALAFVPWSDWAMTGLHGAASSETLWTITWYFAEAGAFVFGSGLAIVPFLHGGVVNEFHWLTEQQFLDAVAVAMITPGPVVITVAFIGYLAGGPAGALLAALGVFLPCFLLTVLPAPHFRRFARNPQVKAFVDGVTAAAAGAIAGAAFVLGRRAVFDVATVMLFAATLLVLTRVKKAPEPLIIVAAGVVGMVLTTARAG
ncbi:chromate transporter [Myxococcota bacterium]|nr:chromate transporter [Myxococcota bacterium]MCK6575919.1 chromate transporter [Myxococcota bacterium]